MVGTLVNVIAVILGSALGLVAGNRFAASTQHAVVMGLGFVTLSIGLDNSLATGNILVPLFSIALGVIIGEALDIHGGLNALGGWLQTRVGGQPAQETPGQGLSERDRFISGFVTASLVFCVGPLTVLGSLQDGMAGDPELLLIKSALDFFASAAFAASLGVGVMFSALTVFGVQGSIALLGYLAGEVMTSAMIDELTATGGLILMGLSLILMDIKQPRVANYLPALLIAPLIVAIGTALGVDLYPNV
ncbi:MAG: DUF554 domain-containing protein [Anaerolineales bacterium]